MPRDLYIVARTVRRSKLTRLILDLCLLAFSKIILSTYGQYIGREPSLMNSDLVQPGLDVSERLDAFHSLATLHDAMVADAVVEGGWLGVGCFFQALHHVNGSCRISAFTRCSSMAKVTPGAYRCVARAKSPWKHTDL